MLLSDITTVIEASALCPFLHTPLRYLQGLRGAYQATRVSFRPPVVGAPNPEPDEDQCLWLRLEVREGMVKATVGITLSDVGGDHLVEVQRWVTHLLVLAGALHDQPFEG
jgi:hypothetical protein